MRTEYGILYVNYVVFYSDTYREIIKGSIVKYGNKTEQEAEELMNKSDLFHKDFYPPRSLGYLMLFMEHETAYDTAMEVAFGERYLRDKSLEFLELEPNDYYTWTKEYAKANDLEPHYLIYLENADDPSDVLKRIKYKVNK